MTSNFPSPEIDKKLTLFGLFDINFNLRVHFPYFVLKKLQVPVKTACSTHVNLDFGL